jgi:membrane protein implicated in regulation of membrane protease activity
MILAHAFTAKDTFLISNVAASWIIPIDNLLHLVLTAATLAYLIYRWYTFVQDRKKQKDEESKILDTHEDN